jgi:uncharacterized protein YbjT (DUF2867 family)
MKVLITGGTGYIGSRLRRVISEQGHDVRLLVRPGSDAALDGRDSYEIIEGNIFNTNSCLRACDRRDAVVHLIGIIREFPAKGITFDQHHRAATWNIVDAAKRSGVPRFLHMSALGVREDAVAAYHRTKFEAEKIVETSGLRWTIFRPSLVMGSGDHFTGEVIDLLDLPAVPMIGGGKTLFQPIALDDVCTVMTKALSMPETQQQIYELGGPDRISFKDLVAKVAGQVGVRYRTINVPMALLKPIVAMLERYPSFPLTRDQMRMLTEDNTCEIDRFVKAFQIEPRSFEQILPTLLGEAARSKKQPVLL